MKIVVFAAIVSLCNVLGCHKDTIEEPAPISVVMQQCNTTSVSGTSVQVCYQELIEDSRCPANANCGWMGVAKVKLGVAVGTQNHTIQLSTLHMPQQQYFTDTIVSRFHIRLLQVLPYP